MCVCVCKKVKEIEFFVLPFCSDSILEMLRSFLFESPCSSTSCLWCDCVVCGVFVVCLWCVCGVFVVCYLSCLWFVLHFQPT